MFNDTLFGGGGDDVIFAGDGNDVIDAGAGNDILFGEADADTLTGGAGADVFGFAPIADDADLITDWEAADAILVQDVVLTPEDVSRSFDGEETLLRIALPDGGELTIRLTGDQLAEAPMIHLGDAGSYIAYQTPAVLIGEVVDGTAEADQLSGTARNDTISGFAGDDEIYASAGRDDVDAGDGDDRVSGGDGSDILRGGEGDDTLDAGFGADTLLGGVGNDTLYVGSTSDRASNDHVLAEGGAGDDEFWLAAAGATIRGGDGADRLLGGLWEVTGTVDFDGGAGDDEAWVQASAGRYEGGEGTDELTIRGVLTDITSASADPAATLTFSYLPSTVVSPALDIVVTGFERVSFQGADGFGYLLNLAAGDAQANLIEAATLNAEGYDIAMMAFGGDGADTLLGSYSGDWLSGGAGADEIDAGGGLDRILVEEIDDLNGDVISGLSHEGYFVLPGASLSPDSITIEADGDFHLVTFSDHEVSFRLEAVGGVDAYQVRIQGADALFGARLIETGTALGDAIFGGVMDDAIDGGAGDDILLGENGDDVLMGAEGADQIAGGLGADVVEGGAGHDLLYGDAAGW